MPEYILPLGDAEGAATFRSFDAFTRGYIEAMFFTNDPDGELEGCTVEDLSHESIEAIKMTCAAFQKTAAPLLEEAYARNDYSEEQAGRDLWFTRNGHGVGFWDRCQLEADKLGDRLSALCGFRTSFSNVDAYKGDDGKIYLM